MQTISIDMPRGRARELYRAYKKHLHYSQPIDDEIRRTYQQIARGRTIIKAIESIAAAGTDEEGLPKLAIARADQEEAGFRRDGDGSAWMTSNPERLYSHSWGRVNEAACWTFHWPAGTFPTPNKQSYTTYRAIAPVIPIEVRPKRGLQNYHVLWEAEWERIPPRDPLLLRRMGKGDLWLVVAA